MWFGFSPRSSCVRPPMLLAPTAVAVAIAAAIGMLAPRSTSHATVGTTTACVHISGNVAHYCGVATARLSVFPAAFFRHGSCARKRVGGVRLLQIRIGARSGRGPRSLTVPVSPSVRQRGPQSGSRSRRTARRGPSTRASTGGVRAPSTWRTCFRRFCGLACRPFGGTATRSNPSKGLNRRFSERVPARYGRGRASSSSRRSSAFSSCYRGRSARASTSSCRVDRSLLASSHAVAPLA